MLKLLKCLLQMLKLLGLARNGLSAAGLREIAHALPALLHL